MNGRFARILTRFGQRVTLLTDSGEPEIRAFLQPLGHKTAAFPLTPTPLGAVSGKRWLYLGPPAPQLCPGDRVHRGDLALIAQETHPICLGEQTIGCRAILRQEKEAAV